MTQRRKPDVDGLVPRTKRGPRKRRAFPDPAKPVPAALSAAQEAFAHEYVRDHNGTQAAIRAGYSERSAAAQAVRLLRNGKIDALIRQLTAQKRERARMADEEIEEELARIARSRVSRYFGTAGELRSMNELEDDAAAAVASVETRIEMVGRGEEAEPERVTKIKLWDKNTALRTLAQIRGLIGADVQVNIGDEVAEKLAAARARAKARKGGA